MGVYLFIKARIKKNHRIGRIHSNYNNCLKESKQYGPNIQQVVSDGQRNSVSDFQRRKKINLGAENSNRDNQADQAPSYE